MYDLFIKLITLVLVILTLFYLAAIIFPNKMEEAFNETDRKKTIKKTAKYIVLTVGVFASIILVLKILN